MILVYGALEKIIIDNGAQLRGKLFQDLMDQCGIEIHHTANYQAEANPVERVHRVLKTTLSSYVSDDHKKWDRYLAKVGAAVRSSRNKVTVVTPNLINFGREIEYSGQAATVPTYLEDQKVQYTEAHSDALKKLFTAVQKRMSKAHQKRRHTYNLRRRPEVGYGSSYCCSPEK